MFTKLRWCVILSLFLCVLILSPANSLGAKLQKKRCRICKDFVESFERRLEETENSNFAGGDTSWEEEKLGSYANSEVRLVEILDTVCTNHECHSLLENNEEDIERWWFKLRHGGREDLKLWLCHDHLDACCPEGTYGPTCTACPGGRETPCGGHGTCEGEEEKEGRGECSCNAGYEGAACEDCSKGYYNESDSCLACHKACKDSCRGPGPENCDQCAGGYEESEEGVCEDVDECSEDDTLCKEGTYCFNTPGNYKCYACDKSCEKACTGPGPTKCVDCGNGYEKNEAGICKDKNECQEDSSLCSEGTYCENTPGKYICKACNVACKSTCSGPGAENCTECKPGYLRENGTCIDIDECSQESNPCNVETETCQNLVGTHFCKCKQGLVRVDGKCVAAPEKPPTTQPPQAKKKSKKKKKKSKKGAKTVPKEVVQSEAAETDQQPSHEPTLDEQQPSHEPTLDEQQPSHEPTLDEQQPSHEPTLDDQQPSHEPTLDDQQPSHEPTLDEQQPSHEPTLDEQQPSHELTLDEQQPSHEPTLDEQQPSHEPTLDEQQPSHEPTQDEQQPSHEPTQDEQQPSTQVNQQPSHEPTQDRQLNLSHDVSQNTSHDALHDQSQDTPHDKLQESHEEL